MKVVVINKPGHPVPYVGGAERYTQCLVKYLKRAGIDVTYITMTVPSLKSSNKDYFRLINVKLPLYRGHLEGKAFWAIHYATGSLAYSKPLLKLLSEVDIVHVNDGLTSYISSFLKHLSDYKLVLTLHAPPPWQVNYGVNRLLIKTAYNLFYIPGILSADRVIVLSTRTIKALECVFPGLRGKLIPMYLAVDDDIYKPAPKSEISHVLAKYGIKDEYFLFVGRMVREKGIKLLLKVIREGEFREDFVIVGRGPLSHIVSNIAMKLSNVKYIEYVPLNELIPLYSGALALIVPSYAEVSMFNMVSLEAIMCGTPVVISDMFNVGDWLFKQGLGMTFRVGDSKHLLQILVKHKSDLIELKKSLPHNKAVSKFTWKQRILEIISIYKDLIEGY